MKIELSKEQADMFRKLHKSQKDKIKADRIKIILLFFFFFTGEQIADILLIDQDTVTKWKHLFLERKDETSWLEDNYKPYFGKLSCTGISHLRTYINIFKVPSKKELISYLSYDCNVLYKPSGMQKLLHRIGFSHKNIHKLPGGVNIEKQKEFIETFEQEYNQLTEKQAIIFIDSVHPQHNSNSSKMWIETGKERWIQSNTGREHLNIYGAYNPLNQEVIIVEDKTVNGQTTIALLKKIIERYPEKEEFFVHADNASYNKSKEVNEFIKSQSIIKMRYLPPYSPNLNLIERLWKFMREKVINLKYYPTFQGFKNAALNFFNDIQKYKDALRNFITLKFQTFNSVELRN